MDPHPTMIPTTHPIAQPKRHPYRLSRLCTDDRRVSLYCTMGRPFSPKNLPLPMGDLHPHLIHGSPGPPKSSTQKAARHKATLPHRMDGSVVLARWHKYILPSGHIGATWRVRLNLFPSSTQDHNPNGKSTTSAVFAQLMAPLSSKIAHSSGGSGPHLTRCLGPIRVKRSKGILIGSAVFAGLTSVTDQLTDHGIRSVTTGRCYVCSTAMPRIVKTVMVDGSRPHTRAVC